MKTTHQLPLRFLLVSILIIVFSQREGNAQEKPRLAIFSGPTATIQNSHPLITSNKARAENELPLLTNDAGEKLPFDRLYYQKIAAPVTVYVEMFTAHPLESDVKELYGAPDGFVDENGKFRKTRSSPSDKPVLKVVLRPEDGLYPLPYMAVQASGKPWNATAAYPGAPFAESRQTFYPNASRIFEEIERNGGNIYGEADYDFYRPAPAGGYTSGCQLASERTLVKEIFRRKRWVKIFSPMARTVLRKTVCNWLKLPTWYRQ